MGVSGTSRTLFFVLPPGTIVASTFFCSTLTMRRGARRSSRRGLPSVRNQEETRIARRPKLAPGEVARLTFEAPSRSRARGVEPSLIDLRCN